MTVCKKNLWRSIGIALAVIVILKDQLSKWWLMTHFFNGLYKDGPVPFGTWLASTGERLGHAPYVFTDFFNVVLVWNAGISFGMLRTDTPTMIYALSGMAVCVALGFLVWLWREPRPLLAICIGLVVGGALGNVWDRLRYGAVIDFLDFHAGDYHFPAFNVADASISLGVVLLLIDMILFPSTEIPKNKNGDVLNETV